MTPATEPETLDELINDCADIPEELRVPAGSAPHPPAPQQWVVDEACHSQVAGLDAY
ncbi:MAG TPA: hypothetical protein VJT49_05505 [Amycolatopsis sp.]|uniref:hypothetical protein n=1 Tax=Amycolatopsis sp. TaxID=37632 RepID=UPI002B4857A2|nr:hypothetical protein [Amycolatopsis sp.]HKS44563.1 hypothetical protein [Amycolatopsis sp.]